MAAAPLGLITLDLYHHGTLGPLLLVPLVVAVLANSRHAARQRDEHLRFERLYEAASRTARRSAASSCSTTSASISGYSSGIC